LVSASDIFNAKILIVDDQQANVILLERLLRGGGYAAVTNTIYPGEVCALHIKNGYDLILLDIHMPVMDGFQVLEGLKKIEPDDYLPVLVITAQPNHKLRALQVGAKDFISKPFEVAEVLARVHNMLEVRLLHQEAKRYSEALESSVQELETSQELIRSQSNEVKRLYDELVVEHQRSITMSAQPGEMVGVGKEERLATHWLHSLRLRHPWLQLNLLTAFVAAAVVGMFQETIDRLLILTMFLPVLADQAVNTGSQTLAITLRGIILGELHKGKGKALVEKEALLGLLNGVLVGLVAAMGMYGVAFSQHSPSAVMLSVVVFLAMVGSCIISGICGAIVPLILKRLGADPVVASSIFLTTATNVVSMGLLLGLAAFLVK
jgi:magnesium transporter